MTRHENRGFVITKEHLHEDLAYSVDFTDFEYVMSTGDGLPQAFANAGEVRSEMGKLAEVGNPSSGGSTPPDRRNGLFEKADLSTTSRRVQDCRKRLVVDR